MSSTAGQVEESRALDALIDVDKTSVQLDHRSRKRILVKRWEIAQILLRSASTVLAVVLVLLVFGVAVQPGDGNIYFSLAPLALPPSAGVLMWDVGEYVTLCARRGRGITPKAHIGIELIITLGLVATTTVLGIEIGYFLPSATNYYFSFPYNRILANSSIAGTAILGLLTIIHGILFVRACIDRHREVKEGRPRVMYIPETGQAVYVLAQAKSASKPRFRSPPVNRPPLRGPTSATPTGEQHSLAPIYPGESDDMSLVKPFAKGKAPGTPPRGPPPGHVPDEAEIARQLRGDAQPQFFMPFELGNKFTSSVTGSDARIPEGKFLVKTPLSKLEATSSRRSI